MAEGETKLHSRNDSNNNSKRNTRSSNNNNNKSNNNGSIISSSRSKQLTSHQQQDKLAAGSSDERQTSSSRSISTSSLLSPTASASPSSLFSSSSTATLSPSPSLKSFLTSTLTLKPFYKRGFSSRWLQAVIVLFIAVLLAAFICSSRLCDEPGIHSLPTFISNRFCSNSSSLPPSTSSSTPPLSSSSSSSPTSSSPSSSPSSAPSPSSSSPLSSPSSSSPLPPSSTTLSSPLSSPSPSSPPQPPPSREDYGWRPPDEAVWRKFGTDKCTIERISASDLTPEHFEAEIRFKQPVIVTFPNGAADWTTPEDWSRSSLTQAYRHWTIRSGESLEIVRKGGNAFHASSFEDYVEELLHQDNAENGSAEPKHYAFDREFFWYSKLGSGLRLPPYFKINSSLGNGAGDESIFFLGPSLSGVVFHKHSDTWNGVVHGYKRWFLYPNTHTPPGGVYHGFSLLNWVKDVYPHLAETDKPWECVQQPGEILYLPEGTYHATLNFGDTIAVGIQKREATLKAELLSYEATKLHNFLQAQDKPDPENVFNRRLLQIYKEWHELLPESSEAILKVGMMLFEMGEYQEALPWHRKAIQMDRFFIVAYLHLGKTLTELRQYLEAEEAFLAAINLSPQLWDCYKEYGEFLLKMGRHRDALAVFKKGTELKPDLIPFWFYYKLCQVHLGDLEGAEVTEKVIQNLKDGRHS